MAILGFTGQPIHVGSWGLPDLGITEKLSGSRTGSQTGQGGSDVFKNNPTKGQSWTAPTLNTQYNQNAAYQPGAVDPKMAAKYALANNLKGDQLTASMIPLINNNGSVLGKSGSGINTTNTNPTPSNPILPGGDQNTQPDINQQLNDIYNQGMGYLGEQEQALRGQEQDIYNQYTQPIEALRPGIESARQNQVMANQYQTQNAIDAAIRLYNEMNTRARQMFGGSNSAGQFANQFYGRENQRQLGNIQNQAGQNQYNIEDTYQKNLKELENQKTQAITTAKQDFQARMDRINQMKFQFAQDKANARLAELQNYRARVQQIQDQANQFAQTQQNMLLQAKLNTGNNITSTSLGSYNPQYSTLNQGSNQYNASPITGQVDLTQLRKQYGF